MITKLVPKDRIDQAAGLWPNRLIADYLDEAVARDPERTAIIAYSAATDTTIRKSFGDLDRASTRAALGLASLGVGRGDVVSFHLPNRWEFLALYAACTRLGCGLASKYDNAEALVVQTAGAAST